MAFVHPNLRTPRINMEIVQYNAIALKFLIPSERTDIILKAAISQHRKGFRLLQKSEKTLERCRLFIDRWSPLNTLDLQYIPSGMLEKLGLDRTGVPLKRITVAGPGTQRSGPMHPLLSVSAPLSSVSALSAAPPAAPLVIEGQPTFYVISSSEFHKMMVGMTSSSVSAPLPSAPPPSAPPPSSPYLPNPYQASPPQSLKGVGPPIPSVPPRIPASPSCAPSPPSYIPAPSQRSYGRPSNFNPELYQRTQI